MEKNQWRMVAQCTVAGDHHHRRGATVAGA
jgi:hypothetical protein